MLLDRFMLIRKWLAALLLEVPLLAATQVLRLHGGEGGER